MIPLIIVVSLFIGIEVVSYFFNLQLLRLKIFRWLLWPGVFVHEASHYIGCKLMRAPVSEFKVGWQEGHVRHGKSPIPLLGAFIISLAPLFVGTVLLIVLSFWYFSLTWMDFKELMRVAMNSDWSATYTLVKSMIHPALFFQWAALATWKFWVYLFCLINVLATFAPSKQDIKNVAVILVLYILASVFIPQLAGINSFVAFALSIAAILLAIMTAIMYGAVLIKKVLGTKIA